MVSLKKKYSFHLISLTWRVSKKDPLDVKADNCLCVKCSTTLSKNWSQWIAKIPDKAFKVDSKVESITIFYLLLHFSSSNMVLDCSELDLRLVSGLWLREHWYLVGVREPLESTETYIELGCSGIWPWGHIYNIQVNQMFSPLHWNKKHSKQWTVRWQIGHTSLSSCRLKSVCSLWHVRLDR